jgi:biopolymer transport protein ExbB/TolQ
MKAKNSKEVARGYLMFAIGICFSIAAGFICVWLFTVTADKEVARMEIRSREYDSAFARQLSLTDRVDSLYNNIALLNSGHRMNEAVLHNRISNQKMSIIGTIAEMDKRDVLLYGKMSEEVNLILQSKDSIRLVGSQVELIKSDLQRCIEDNRIATRKMIFNNPTNR